MKTALAVLSLALSPVLFAQSSICDYCQHIGTTYLFESTNTQQVVIGLQTDNPLTVAYDITIAYTIGDSPVVNIQHSRKQRMIYSNIPPSQYFTAEVFTIIPDGDNGTFRVLSVTVDEVQPPAVFSITNGSLAMRR